MKKKEILQIHSLLHILQQHAIAEYEVDGEAFEEYESLDITPYQVYERKEEHKEAVFALSESIIGTLEEDSGGHDDDRTEPIAAK
ncbi:UPF0058 family protein [Halococcus sediminicola]|uniref:UPF0058 family protein n=1 Tax=Halococcus sediminicola TaxID=1264579 RepID=UPI00067916EA|nr:UPF0058 family protein [Halococcus sediminicola]